MIIARFNEALAQDDIEAQEAIFDEVGDLEGDAHTEVLCQLLAACIAPPEKKTAAAVSRLIELGAIEFVVPSELPGFAFRDRR